MQAAMLLLMALLPPSAAAAAFDRMNTTNDVRDTVNFDFGWRFAPAQEQRDLAQCTFEQNRNYGQGSIWAGPTASKEECCSECANRELCMSWDWNGNLCYVKDNTVGAKVQNGRWSGKLRASFTKNASFSWPGHLAVPAQAQPEFDDARWEVVDAPHDFGRERMETCLGGGRRRMSIDSAVSSAVVVHPMQNCSGFYRKHFKLPASWKNGVTWVYFEGVYHNSAMWLNGKPLGAHENGYTSFWHRLDTAGAEFGNNIDNIIAIYANGAPGTGYWYGGAGLTRHQYLVHTPGPLYLPPDRTWVHASVVGQIVSNGPQPGHGQRAMATLVAEGTIENGATATADDVWVSIRFISGHDSASVAEATAGPFSLVGSKNFSIRVSPSQQLQLWSVARPFLYVAQVQVHVGGPTGQVVDDMNITFGVRKVRLDANTGMYLNNKHLKMRGYCDHSSFGGVGSAVPDRVQLFHAQALRAAGGNSWRMAHNPPVPARLDIADRVGLLVIDENHFYGEHGRPYGVYNPETKLESQRDLAELVSRDRNHPSVWVWNLCNEVNCNNDLSTVQGMRNVTDLYDGTRPITMNHLIDQPAEAYLDIQGMSHRAGAHQDSWHQANPKKPGFASEAVICFSERDVDTDFCPGVDGTQARLPSQAGFCRFNNEVSNCTATQLLPSDSRLFMAGTYIWSGFDYDVDGSQSGAQATATGMLADRVGFEKPLVWWFRSWWLSNISATDAGRPLLWPSAAAQPFTCRIVDSWVPPPAGNTTRSVHVYSNAASVQLYVNGKLAGGMGVSAAKIEYFGMGVFPVVHYAAGNLTAVALDATGQAVATHSIFTPGNLSRILLTVDAPSPHTGTGTVLVADGQDVAMVTASLVDSRGFRISAQDPNASTNITIRVVSGGGRLLGLHNGNPADVPDGLGSTFPDSLRVRQLSRYINIDAGKTGERALSRNSAAIVVEEDDNSVDATVLEPIVVEASAKGLPSTNISISLTTDSRFSALNVASDLAASVSANLL